MAARKQEVVERDEEAETAFEGIAQDAMDRAAAVKCSVEEYRCGLRHIIGSLHVALDAAKHDK